MAKGRSSNKLTKAEKESIRLADTYGAPKAIAVDEETEKEESYWDARAARKEAAKIEKAREKGEREKQKAQAKNDDDDDKPRSQRKGNIELTTYKDKEGRTVTESRQITQHEEKPGFFKRLFGKSDERIGGNGYVRGEGYPQDRQDSRTVPVVAVNKGNETGVTGKYENAPADWGRGLTREAINEARSGKIVYQEQKFVGSTSFGTLTFVGLDNKIHCARVFSGGAGNGALPGTANGTNSRDHRHGGQYVGEYTIQKLGPSGNIGPWYYMSDVAGRSELGMHRDFGQDSKSKGCPNWHPADTAIIDTYLKPLLDSRGSMKFAIEPTLDRDNRYADHNRNRDNDHSRNVAENERGLNPREIQVAALDKSKIR